MKEAELKELLLQCIDRYEHHVIECLAAARAGNPTLANVHHRQSYQHYSAARQLLKSAFGGDFTGLFDLKLDENLQSNPVSETTELEITFNYIRETVEMGLHYALTARDRALTPRPMPEGERLKNEYDTFGQFDTLTELIGKFMHHAYEPEGDRECVNLETTVKTFTAEEYAEHLAQQAGASATPKAPTPAEILGKG